MKKTLLYTILVLFSPLIAFSQAYLEPGLLNSYKNLLEVKSVIVSFHGKGGPKNENISLLTGLGITNIKMLKNLPIVEIPANKLLVQTLSALPSVRSIVENKPLQFMNANSTNITGVRRLQEDPNITAANGGMPVDGTGVTVGIIDSGVDGLHPDLLFGTKLIRNVLGQPNTVFDLGGINPPVYLDMIPSTDQNSGHGTHCSGTIAGTGSMSDGQYRGAAPGAKLVGYGTGAGILVLSAISGFDYMLEKHQELGIKVVSCSFGSSGSFNENTPTSIATKALYDAGVLVVYAAGNSGPGNNTIGPDAKAPWVVGVGAGDRFGRLADFSSRGVRGDERAFEMDGRIWITKNRPTIVAPGVDVISTRALSPLGLLGLPDDITELTPAQIPFYTHSSGTSMATPHVSGIIALMLQANPSLTPQQIIDMLQETATNMPGHEEHEVGAGYVNAYAAVVRAMGVNNFGGLNNLKRAFKSSVLLNVERNDFEFAYSPLPTSANEFKFQVPEGIASLEMFAEALGPNSVEPGNPIFIALRSPSGQRFSSGLPLTFVLDYARTAVVANPEPGEWTVEAGGAIGTAAGVAIPIPGGVPLVGLPETVRGTLTFNRSGALVNLGDISTSPFVKDIVAGVSRRLIDGRVSGFQPESPILRQEMADYLTMALGIRQFLPISNAPIIPDVSNVLLVSSVTNTGAALRDLSHAQNPVVKLENGLFLPNAFATRAEIAYSIVQALGLQNLAESGANQPVVFRVNGATLDVTDLNGVDATTKAYIRLALEMGLVSCTVVGNEAKFNPAANMSRAEYARSMVLASNVWNQSPLAAPVVTSVNSKKSNVFSSLRSYPNPASTTTTFEYTVNQTGSVEIELMDITGRKVLSVSNGKQNAGTYSINLDLSDVQNGIYMIRISNGTNIQNSRIVVQK